MFSLPIPSVKELLRNLLLINNRPRHHRSLRTCAGLGGSRGLMLLMSLSASTSTAWSNDGPGLWSTASLTDARGLQLAITTTEFVSALVVTDSCLKYTQALTSSLQAEAKDIVAAVREINTVIATVQDVRDNIDTHHSRWFLAISDMLSQVGVEPSVPRRCGRQIHHSNLPADTPSEYYRCTVSIPVVDHLLSELRSRFGDHQKRAMLGLSIVPSLFVSLESYVQDQSAC